MVVWFNVAVVVDVGVDVVVVVSPNVHANIHVNHDGHNAAAMCLHSYQ